MRDTEYGDTAVCHDCYSACVITGLDTAFDAYGPSGNTRTYYHPGHGDMVTNCCESDDYTPTTDADECEAFLAVLEPRVELTARIIDDMAEYFADVRYARRYNCSSEV